MIKLLAVKRLVVTPNLDGRSSLWLARRFGAHFFKGIEIAKVIWYRRGMMVEKDAQTVSFNCLGGPFDHHPHQDFPGQCTFTLVAQAIGVYDKPEFSQMIAAIRQIDLKGGSGELYGKLRMMNENPHLTDERIQQWLELLLDAWHADQTDYHSRAVEETIEEADAVKTRYGWVVTIDHPNRNVARRVRSGSYGYQESAVTCQQVGDQIEVLFEIERVPAQLIRQIAGAIADALCRAVGQEVAPNRTAFYRRGGQTLDWFFFVNSDGMPMAIYGTSKYLDLVRITEIVRNALRDPNEATVVF